MKDINKRLNLELSVNGQRGLEGLVRTLASLDKEMEKQKKSGSDQLKQTQAMYDYIEKRVKSTLNEELKAARLKSEAEEKYLKILQSTDEYKRKQAQERRKERNEALSYWRMRGKTMAEANKLSTTGRRGIQEDIALRRAREQEELALRREQEALASRRAQEDLALRRAQGDTTSKRQSFMFDIGKMKFDPLEMIRSRWQKAEETRAEALVAQTRAQRILSNANASDAQKAAAKAAFKSARATEGEAATQAAGLAKAGATVAIISAVWDTTKKIASTFNGMLKDTLGISLSIKDNFRDILSNVKQSLDMYRGIATYGVGTSLITNAQARESMMRYGLGAGQNYGFMQARQLLGLTTEEDLMYMNPAQSAVFSQYMQRYSAWYDELSRSGVLKNIQSLQLEFAMFKQEMSVEFLQWVGENKESIMTVLKGSLSVLEWIFEAIAKVANFFMPGSIVKSSATANASGGTSKQVIVNMTTNATGVLGSQEEMQGFFREEMDRLAGEISVELGE